MVFDPELERGTTTLIDLSGKLSTQDPDRWLVEAVDVPASQLPYLDALLKAAGASGAINGRKLSRDTWIAEGVAAMRPQADLQQKNWKPLRKLTSVQLEILRRGKDCLDSEGNQRFGEKPHLAWKAMKTTIRKRLKKEKLGADI